MTSLAQDLHFILFPFMAQGHIIPMVDIARLLAQRSATVTIISTPLNAGRFKTIITRSVQAGLQIRVVELYFPCEEAGLPKGCENFEMIPTPNMAANFFAATGMLRQPLENFLGEIKPPPSCIISDMGFPWTTDVAHKFHIPRFVFHGPCCFSLLCSYKIFTSGVLDKVTSASEYFVVPGLPDQIELTKSQVRGMVNPDSSSPMKDFVNQIIEAEKAAYGIVVNTFEELEPEYIKEYTKVKGNRVWCIGPVSLCNKDSLDKADRGNKASIDERDCLNWLGSQEPSAVVYVCLGSLSRLATSQLIELGLGLEESNRPFIWCISYKTEEFEKWILEDGFEERIKGRGLLIRGWAPQILILSHSAIGGFLTHCGWNSTLEGICAGVPLLTWPLFADQFMNESLVVQILRIGVKVGAEVPIISGEEEKVGVLVKRDGVKMAVDRLMNEEEGGERRKRARELGEMARRAMEEGGSSYLNMTLVIQEIKEQANG